MRRLLALTALVTMTWPHVAVMTCGAERAGSDGSTVMSVAAEHRHDGPTCPVLMACTTAMVEGVAVSALIEVDTPPQPLGRAVVVAPTGTVLTADPPPPRPYA